jgi:hypothetical protein
MNENPGGKREQLEQHSLPGTNQAGKGADPCENDSDQERRSRAGDRSQLEEHSLPGTNQAGKGPDDGDVAKDELAGRETQHRDEGPLPR